MHSFMQNIQGQFASNYINPVHKSWTEESLKKYFLDGFSETETFLQIINL